MGSLRKQSTFRDAGVLVSPRNGDRRNSILMTCHHTDLGNASIAFEARPIRSATRIRVVMTRHQYEISALVPQTLFAGENQW